MRDDIPPRPKRRRPYGLICAARRPAPDQDRAPDRRARALGLRRPVRRLGDQPHKRRPARRTDPRRAGPLPRRSDTHPAPRPAAPQPSRRTRRASPPRALQHRQSNPAPNTHRRTPRRDLDRRTRAGLLTTLPPSPDSAAKPRWTDELSTEPRQRPPQAGRRPDLDSSSAGATTLQVRGVNEHTSQLWSLCRSVVPHDPVTIQGDAAITILAVRQHSCLTGFGAATCW